jgi:hypothetical protein
MYLGAPLRDQEAGVRVAQVVEADEPERLAWTHPGQHRAQDERAYRLVLDIEEPPDLTERAGPGEGRHVLLRVDLERRDLRGRGRPGCPACSTSCDAKPDAWDAAAIPMHAPLSKSPLSRIRRQPSSVCPE